MYGALIPHPGPLAVGEGSERKKSDLISGCLWSLSQTPFSLPKETSRAALKKTLLLGSKTGRQRPGQDRRSEPDTAYCVFGVSSWKGCFI